MWVWVCLISSQKHRKTEGKEEKEGGKEGFESGAKGGKEGKTH